MTTFLSSLQSVPALLVYVVVALLVLGESAAFVGLVLPGETALLAAGATAAVGHASLPAVIVTAAVGAIVGDSVGYWIGRRLGPSARSSRAGRWVGEARWARAELVLGRRGGLAVLTGRWIGVLRALVPALAGMTGMPYRQYMVYNVIGGVAWVGGVSTAGYLAGAALGATALGVLSLGLLGLTVTVVALRLVVVVLRRAVTARRPRLAPAVAPGVLSVVGLGVFAAAAADVSHGGRLTALDTPVLAWFVGHRSGAVTTFATILTTLGSPVASAVLALVAAAVLLRTVAGRGPAALVLVSTGVAGAAILAAKHVVGRTRPPALTQLVVETDASFPSGHVTGSLVLYGVLTLVALHHVRGTSSRRAVVLVAGTVVAATAVIRLYLGVHWFSDIVGALLLGGSLLLAAVAVDRVRNPSWAAAQALPPASPEPVAVAAAVGELAPSS